ncbi:MAG: hypothetical protein KJO98_00340 [Rhodothermia bacterium]|nr:hypothetical protein [Rhodothermia bacterium]
MHAINWRPRIHGDDILKLQGADPVELRRRSPRASSAADWAAEAGVDLVTAGVLSRRLRIQERRHEKIWFKDRSSLRGRFVATHLARAEDVVVAVCSIGGTLEARVSEAAYSDPAFALALEQYGILAVGSLADHVAELITDCATAEGLNVSDRLSPGMIGWTLESGQEQVFRQLDGCGDAVVLTESGYMQPRMSVSFLIGLGQGLMAGNGTGCDNCSIRMRCSYRSYYE